MYAAPFYKQRFQSPLVYKASKQFIMLTGHSKKSLERFEKRTHKAANE